MTLAQAVLGYLATAFVTTSLLGVVARRRYRQWYAFTLYLGAVSAFHLLAVFWPGRFYTRGAWTANEIVANVLCFATALELALRTFRWFPAARRTLSMGVLAVLLVTLVRVMAVTPAQLDYRRFASEVIPHILDGSVWLFTIIAALILWYRLPVNGFHKRVVLSYVPYLLLFASVLNSIRGLGWDRAVFVYASYANQVGYLLLVGFWTYAAWRRDPQPASALEEPTPTTPALSTASTAA